MRVARVVGNIVSVIKEPCHQGKKLMLVSFLDDEGKELPEEHVYVDASGAGIGDIVLVCEDGGAAELEFDLAGGDCIFDGLIVGIVDSMQPECFGLPDMSDRVV